MPLNITSESYNGLNSLYANAGDWVDGIATFSTRFSAGSGVSNKFTYNTQGSQYSLTIQQGNLGDYGFMQGDTIVCTYTLYGVVPPLQNQTFTTTILYVSGNTIYLADPFTYLVTVEHVDGRQFPTDNYCSGLLVVVDKAPNSAEFYFNLTTNGSSMINSVLDSEVNRFEIQDLDTLGLGLSTLLTQLTNKSGGLVKDVEITFVAQPSGYWRDYEITYKFWQWGVIKDGYPEPNYYEQADCLAPIVRIKAFSQYGNPNGVLTDTSQNTESNTGGFDENYNGGINLYNATGITWQDSLGDTITALDYSGSCTFEATVETVGQNNPSSTYRLGLVWRPIDGTYYQNIADYNVGENLLLVAPEVDFIADGVMAVGPFLGEEDSSGARWDFANITMSLTGSLLTITGTIIPNGQAQGLFSGVPDGGRLSTLWVSIGDFTVDGTITSKRVSLKIFNEDNYDAPTLGVQIPNVINEFLYDHALNDVTTPLPQTTTEDDVLYSSQFHLIQGVNYQGVRARVYAYDTVTEDEFTLEDIFFSFTSVVNIGGVFQPNFVVPRGFNLPPTSDRNHISLTREPSLDVGALYGVKLEYGYLSRWQYWLEQSNVNNDFFDITQMWDGKNKDWQRFSNSGNWIVRVSYYTRLNGVDDFNHQEVGIRPYEDDPNINTTWGIEVLSTGATPVNLVANELHEITATLVWSIGAYTNAWSELTIEDFEAGNRWVISSVLEQGGIANNPLQPIAGQTYLDMQFPAVNIAVLKAYVDTNLVSVDKVCLSARIYSEDEPYPTGWEWLIGNVKDAERAYSVARKLSPDSVYAGALIRVRRSSDNTEADIPHILIGFEYVLDETALLAFTGNTASDFGYVVTRYDQSGFGNDAEQTSMSAQAPIVMHGVVVTDPDTSRPAMLCDGVNHYAEMLFFNTSREMLFFSVFNRIGSATESIGFGGSSTFPYSLRWSFLGIVYDGIGNIAPNNIHFTGQTQTGAQLNILYRGVSGLNNIDMRLNGVVGTVINEVDGGGVLDKLEYTNAVLHDGYKSEDVMYAQDRDNTDIWIENNVNTFYAIY